MTYADLSMHSDQADQQVDINKTAYGVLNRSSPEPLYRQLASHFESEIGSGRLKPGDRLESEGLLIDRFQVSRITLRQAVAELVRKQLVVRKQGKGTFVTVPAVRHDLKRSHGLLGSLFAQAHGASARLLRYELRVPPAEIMALLDTAANQPALALDRLYLIGGRPVALAQAWLVPEVGVLSRTTAKLMSTEDMMHQAGIVIASSQVTMRAALPGTAIARVLDISPRAPVLILRRKTVGDDGVVKEVGSIWFCSDAYEFVCTTGNPNRMESLFDIRNVSGKV